MIMAAGLGTRMRPLTDDRPKPMVQVRGRALIDHALDRLVAAGVRLAVVNLHYKADLLKAHLDRRSDIEIRYSLETDELLGTGGGVIKALPQFDGEPFFILNSDSIWVERGEPALPMMQRRWNESAMDGLLLLADLDTAMGFDGAGDFALESDGRLARAVGHDGPVFAYPGVQIVHPRLFTDPPPGAFSTNLMWNRAIAKHRLFGAHLHGVWIHVGTPQAVAEADAYLAARA
jgi:MurNAc alpha-1-phosphate uridylyltransferase